MRPRVDASGGAFLYGTIGLVTVGLSSRVLPHARFTGAQRVGALNTKS